MPPGLAIRTAIGGAFFLAPPEHSRTRKITIRSDAYLCNYSFEQCSQTQKSDETVPVIENLGST